MLIVLGHKNVSFTRGYAGYVRVQLTKVQLGKTIGWVRENRKASSEDHFMLSSNARLGHKADSNRIGIEVLELAAAKPMWDLIAIYVARLDNLCRPVIHNALWTIKAAEYHWSQPPFRVGGRKAT